MSIKVILMKELIFKAIMHIAIEEEWLGQLK